MSCCDHDQEIIEVFPTRQMPQDAKEANISSTFVGENFINCKLSRVEPKFIRYLYALSLEGRRRHTLLCEIGCKLRKAENFQNCCPSRKPILVNYRDSKTMEGPGTWKNCFDVVGWGALFGCGQMMIILSFLGAHIVPSMLDYYFALKDPNNGKCRRVGMTASDYLLLIASVRIGILFFVWFSVACFSMVDQFAREIYYDYPFRRRDPPRTPVVDVENGVCTSNDVSHESLGSSSSNGQHDNQTSTENRKPEENSSPPPYVPVINPDQNFRVCWILFFSVIGLLYVLSMWSIGVILLHHCKNEMTSGQFWKMVVTMVSFTLL